MFRAVLRKMSHWTWRCTILYTIQREWGTEHRYTGWMETWGSPWWSVR